MPNDLWNRKGDPDSCRQSHDRWVRCSSSTLLVLYSSVSVCESVCDCWYHIPGAVNAPLFQFFKLRSQLKSHRKLENKSFRRHVALHNANMKRLANHVSKCLFTSHCIITSHSNWRGVVAHWNTAALMIAAQWCSTVASQQEGPGFEHWLDLSLWRSHVLPVPLWLHPTYPKTHS